MSRTSLATIVFAALSTLLGACGDSRSVRPPADVSCRPDQPSPYPAGIPYVGIHANAGNGGVVDCHGASSFREAWHVLQGHAVVQPNTFSPDGRVVYVTTTAPELDGCRVHALAESDGHTLWCRSYPPTVVGSAIEVDADGNLYFTAGRSVCSLTPAGEDRWETVMPDAGAEGALSGPLGLHFTPAGHVATITNDGVVYVLARGDGRILASLDVPATFGFVPPAALGDFDFTRVAPEAVADHLRTVFGESGATGFFGAFLGAGGGFSDNTVGVSTRGAILVIGGGPDPENGALVEVRIDGTDSAPVLRPGWAMITHGGSATSPAITTDGRYAVIGDGSTAGALLDPTATREASVEVVDTLACDGNTDGDPDPARCAPAWQAPMRRGPMAGSPAIADDGTVYLWETTVRIGEFGPDAVDVRALGSAGPVWERALPDDLTWTSVMTLTRDYVYGTATRVYPSSTRVLGFTFPSHAESHVVVLDRRSGELLFRAPVTDDSAATVTIGPDGSLYVGLLGLVSMLSVDQTPVLGLARFAPTGE